MNRRQLLRRLLGGSLNVSFSDMVNLVRQFLKLVERYNLQLEDET